MQTIPAERVRQRLAVENTWWESGAIPSEYEEMHRRAYFRVFRDLVTGRPRRAVVLMGPRRVGKTVLLHHVIGGLMADGIEPTSIAYVSIDHPLYTGLDLEGLVALVEQATPSAPAPRYVFLDEIQYHRDWERHLKVLVDSRKDIQFVVSGSAAAALRLKSLESGAGRFTDFLLPPLSFHEFLLLRGEDGLVTLLDPDEWATTADITSLNRLFLDYLNYGGYPEAALSEAVQRDPGRFIKNDIIDKVLLRDLPSLYGIQDIQELNSLFTTLAYNTGQEVSLEALAKTSGVAKPTIKRYVEYLEAAFLLRRVDRIDRNARRFKRQTAFKVYLTNPSIRAALFAPLSPGDADLGHVVETAVFAQWFHTDSSDLYYARWSDGEVDLVHYAPAVGVWWAVEAKWSDRYLSRPQDLRSLLRFCKENGLSKALVTTETERGEAKANGVAIEFVPASLYCYTIGKNLAEGIASMERAHLGALLG